MTILSKKSFSIRQRAAAIASAIALSCVTAFPAAGQQQWDMPLAWPAGNLHVKNAQIFANEVKKATNGNVDIKLHTGGSLGFKGPEVFTAVRRGNVPIADIVLNQQVGVEPFFEIISLPYLVQGFVEMRAMMMYARPTLDDLAKKHNQRILYAVPWPSQMVYSKTEFTELEDLQDLKIRTSDKTSTDIFRLFGASPIQLPWAEVVPALASGVIDGVTTSTTSGVDGTFWEFMDYGMLLRHQTTTNIVTVNMDAWGRLSPEERLIISDLGRRLETKFWHNVIKEDEEKLATLAKNGMKINHPSPELTSQLLEKSRVLWDDFLKRVPDAQPTMDAYRQFVGK